MNTNQEIVDLYLNGKISKEKLLERMPLFGKEDFVYLSSQIDRMSYNNQKVSKDSQLEIWKNIERKTKPSGLHLSLSSRLAIASAILLLLVVSIWVFRNNESDSTPLYYSNHLSDIQVVNLPDNSTIHLHPGASLKYEAGKTRNTYLRGKALFDVSHQEGKAFVVHTPKSKTRVIGTVFTIDSEHEVREVITLLEGKIKYEYYQQDSILQSVEMLPGDHLIYDHERMKIMESSHQDKVSLDRDKGILYLDKANIMEVKNVLDDWYNIELLLPPEENITERIVHKIDTRTMTAKDVIEGINLIADYKLTPLINNQYVVEK